MLLRLCFILLALFVLPVHAQENSDFDTSPKVTPAIYATQSAVVPGEELTLIIEHNAVPHWHTYWKNTGDSGAAPQFTFTLSEGLTQKGEIGFPVPEALPYGPLINFGHEGQILYTATIQADDTLSLNTTATINVAMEWLVCKDICIPETGNLTIELPVAETAEPDNQNLLDLANAQAPMASPFTDARYSIKNDQLIISVNGVQDANNAYFFPYEWGVIQNLEKQEYTIKDTSLILTVPRDTRDISPFETLDGVLRVDDNAYEVSLEKSEDYVDTQANASPIDLTNINQQYEGLDLSNYSLATILAFAFLGGLILNLMPCVFPVLSMKALSLVHHSHGARLHAIGHGLSYTIGIILSFLIIAGALIALQLSGAQIGWGFQLQNPIIVLSLATLLFVIGLNLSGFFDISTNASGFGSSLAQKQGYTGSFFTGVLATLVATPCTAPFMATALGFALTQPPFISLSIFAMLGFGLAFPFLLLTITPALAAILPKPGDWMVRFKELLAFPMYLSAIWLGWVFIEQVPSFTFIHLVIGAVLVTFIIWLIKAWPKSMIMRLLSLIVIIALLTCAGSFAFMQKASHPINNDEQTQKFEETSALPFTTLTLAENLMSNRPVLVNMTADWCITCKVNERLALSSNNFKQRLSDINVAYLKGDWTNKNPEITAYLKGFGRNGVPLYVYYPAPIDGKRPEAQVLPQLLTEKIVLNIVQ